MVTGAARVPGPAGLMKPLSRIAGEGPIYRVAARWVLRRSSAALSWASCAVPMILGLIGWSTSRPTGRPGVDIGVAGVGRRRVLRRQRAGRLERAEQVALIGDDRVRDLLVLGHGDDPVGDDAVALDRAAGRRVIERSRQAQRAMALDRNDALHRSLAKAVGPDDRRTVVVLQCAGDDLRGRGRGAVDQHHDRRSPNQVAARQRIVLPVIVGIAARASSPPCRIEKIGGYLDRGVERPPASLRRSRASPESRPPVCWRRRLSAARSSAGVVSSKVLIRT